MRHLGDLGTRRNSVSLGDLKGRGKVNPDDPGIVVIPQANTEVETGSGSAHPTNFISFFFDTKLGIALHEKLHTSFTCKRNYNVESRLVEFRCDAVSGSVIGLNHNSCGLITSTWRARLLLQSEDLRFYQRMRQESFAVLVGN